MNKFNYKLIIYIILFILTLLIPLFAALRYTKGKDPADLNNYEDHNILPKILFYSLIVSYIFIFIILTTSIYQIKNIAHYANLEVKKYHKF